MVVLGRIDDYIGGETCDLDPGPDTTFHVSSSDGWDNIMLAKYDSLGNHMWSFVLWDEGLDPEATKLEIDDEDNIYITGYLTVQVDFDPGPASFILDANANDFKTLFLAKYTADGNFIWADIFEGNSTCIGYQVLTKGNDVYLCGEASNTAYIGFNDTTTITSIWSDYGNGFIAKYDNLMNHQWSGAIAAGPGAYNTVTSIAVNQSGNLYAAGTFSNSADFCPTDTGEVILFSPGAADDYSSDMFISSYTSDGELINAVQIGSEVSFERVDEVFDMKVDLEGNILVTGWFSGILDFDPSSEIFNLTGDNDIFLAKYSSELELIWAFSLAGTYYDIGKEIEIDSDNNVLLYGEYYWNGDFDPGPDEFILEGYNLNTFIAMYDEDGNFITAASLGGDSSFGYENHGMEIGENGSVYLAGFYYGAEDWDLDEDEELILENAGTGGDIVLAKFHYYDPIDPYLSAVSPAQMVNEGAVTLNIDGYNMEEAMAVKLVNPGDTLWASNLLSEGEFDLEAVFAMANEAPGFRDLHVELTDTLLILADAVEILPALLNLPDGRTDYLSAERILINRPEPSISKVTNTGPMDLVTVPVVYRSIPEYIELTNLMGTVDLREHPSFSGLVDFFSSEGLNDSLINVLGVETTGQSMMAMLMPHIEPEEEQLIQMRVRATELEGGNIGIYVHPNGLLTSEALLPDYTPAPTLCMLEMTQDALIQGAPGLIMDDFETCFTPEYLEIQDFLLEVFEDAAENHEVIPLKGLMMKLGMDLIQCQDPVYEITPTILDSVAVKLISHIGTPLIFGPDTDCDSYLELTDQFKSIDSDKKELSVIDFLDSEAKGTPQVAICQAAGMTAGYGCSVGVPYCPDPVGSMDPNDKYGPTNPITVTQHIQVAEELLYSIHFENVDSATVAAKQVYLVDSLDLDVFDITSLKWGYAFWGDTAVAIAGGNQFVDLRPALPNVLKITALVDSSTGLATIDFQTLDTLTYLLTSDVDQGFLPPNVDSPEGMGSITFSIDLKDDVTSGTAFENEAYIYFDYNDPIITPAWWNLYDTIYAGSQVFEEFEALDESHFTVHWGPDDALDPPMLYAIFSSETGLDDNWTLWKDFTTDTQADFEGVIGETYYFYSLALDSAANIEEFPIGYDAEFTFLVDGLEESGNPGVSVSPNPVSDRLSIRFDRADWDVIQLYDSNGNLMESIPVRGLENVLLDMKGLSSGTYVIRAQSDTEQFIQRIIKL
jgi:hypothetical protein